MPATEQTWRSQKLLHVVFGVTSAVMLVATIWMYAADHTREWKDTQKAHNNVTQFYTQGRIDELKTVQFAKDLNAANDRLAEAQSLPVRSEQVADFKKLVEEDAERRGEKPYDLSKVEANLSAGGGNEEGAAERRTAIVNDLNDAVAKAKYREDTLLQERKFAAANLTAALSLRDLAVTEGRLQDVVDQRQAVADKAKGEVEELSTKYEAANLHRKALEKLLKDITSPVDEAQANLVKVQADSKRYEDSVETYVTKLGRTVLGMPILDAFDNSDLRIDQIWLPTLTINYNFSNVARFDRCITCHRANDTSQPGAPTEPAYEHQQDPMQVTLTTPAESPVIEDEPAETQAEDEKEKLSHDEKLLRDAYGLLLSQHGVLRDDAVTVQVVWPKVGDSPARAAEAGLQMGDVIESINGTPVLNRSDAMARLVGEVEWGQPVQLTIRRGLPHPFASHPRLDLYCGSTSPHKQAEMGCTICHDGQGSATAFKWASHTPNDPTEATAWRREHGWFDNHHWIFPMYPQRFVESGCLKCHHSVVELEPSERFPEPPAPKLMEGFHLVQQYGCFGCHEINGFDGPSKRIGPDMRTEPNFYAVAQALLLEPNLTPEEHDWAAQLVHHPERDDARHRLSEAIQLDKALRASSSPSAPEVAKEEGASEGEQLAARFSLTTYKLGDQLKDIESPGQMRKTGPSLRYVGSKEDFNFLYDWISKPKNFRPTTKMPQFFGLWDHLSEEEQKQTAPLEAMEVRSIARYLLDSSQKFEYKTPPEGITEPASIARGAHLFQTRGCLACHTHADFPGIANTQGPDLSLVAAKFTGERGSQWLYSWLLDPSNYHVRTKMPNLLLAPLKGADGKVSDPAADLTAFLLTTSAGLEVAVSGEEVTVKQLLAVSAAAESGKIKAEDKLISVGQEADGELIEVAGKTLAEVTELLRGAPGSSLRVVLERAGEDQPEKIEVGLTRSGYTREHDPAAELTAEEEQTLYDLALENLKKTYPYSTAKRYLETGIQGVDPATIKGDDAVLAGEITPANRNDKLQLYVGRRAISKYGCSGCHDIPGYEDSKPIGTGLADWGRKDPSRLAFEQISQFLPLHGGDHAAAHAAHAGGHAEHGAEAAHDAHAEHAEGHVAEGHANAHSLPPYRMTPAEVESPDTQFYFEAISAHNRQGFIWQKLRQPRSYDYEKVSNKEYNERLRMPQFPFDAQQREAVMTFILGLVAEPPSAAKYIYQPNARQDAIVKGRGVLEKFNCAGCHTLEMERWEFALDGADENFGAPPPAGGYPFLAAHATVEDLTTSLKTDKRGERHATVKGRPAVSEATGKPLLYNEDLDPIEPGEEAEAKEIYYSFELWDNAVVNGHMFQVGAPNMLIKQSAAKRHPDWGGDLAKYLFPVVIAEEKQRNPQVKGGEAWGWLPPPLIGEGRKVQTDWLHNFLLDPTPIRPAVVLRMPKFNMSPDEASILANYFAAVDNAEYPYEYDSRTAATRIHELEAAEPGRLKNALGIVVNNTYCVKCHKVGDFTPAGSEKAMGPNLANVYERMRPEYVRRWIADPRRILPYTGMPVNIPYKPEPPLYGGIAQDIFHGTSFEQLDGLVDLLMKYDVFTSGQVSIQPLVKPAPPAGETPPEGEGEKKAEAAAGETPAGEAPPAEGEKKPAAPGKEKIKDQRQ